MVENLSWYAVVIAHSVDRDRLQPYLAGLGKAYEPFTGKFEDVTAKRGVVHIEGQAFQAVQIVRWNTKNDFMAFYNSEAYQNLRSLREGAGEFSLALVPGAST